LDGDGKPHGAPKVMDVVTEAATALGLAEEMLLLKSAGSLVRHLPIPKSDEHSTVYQALVDILHKFRANVVAKVGVIDELEDWLRHLWILIDLGLAIAIGMVMDGLIFPPWNWFKIDNLSFEDWLSKWGASQSAVNSPVIQVIRQYLFSLEKGIGAGTALHSIMRLLFTYKGAFSYKMQAGMGDTVFGPLYEVLSKRGVKFEFFNRVDNLELSADKSYIEKIHIGIQATLKAPYEPLIDADGLPSWPSSPKYELLEQGEELEQQKVNLENWWTTWKDPVPPKVLEVCKDFDIVVLGISLGAMQFIAKDLIENYAPFRDMVAQVETTQTRSFQIWLSENLSQMGWEKPSPILGTYIEPYNTWGDMSQLIVRESWPPGVVNNVSYFTDQLPDEQPIPGREDHTYPLRQNDRVFLSAVSWLESNIQPLWPAATSSSNPQGLNWDLLVDDQPDTGPARFKSQYWNAPWNPSDRYNLSVPGSVFYRLRENQSGGKNLVLTGDWIKTSWSAGYLEAATISGMQAAGAILGKRLTIAGDWLLEHQREKDVTFDRDFCPCCGDKGTFVQFDGNPVPLQPYQLNGTTMHAFVLRASYQKLLDICDRYLNHGGETVFRPVGPFLAWAAVDIKETITNNPPSWTPERDFAFWIPVMSGKMEGDDFVPNSVGFFLPYVWVDVPLAVTVGREIQGFPKGMADLTMPMSHDDPSTYQITGYAVKTYGEPSPDSKWSKRPILTAQRTDHGLLGHLVADFEDVLGFWTTMLGQLAAMIAEEASGEELFNLGLLKTLIHNGLDMTVPMYFLKQFPDVGDPKCTAYQAITTVPNTVTSKVKGGVLPGNYDIDVYQYASCNVVENLGLHVSGDGENGSQRVSPTFQFWVQFDFSLGEGEVLWKAGSLLHLLITILAGSAFPIPTGKAELHLF
jgi:uncharacterized protein with NAD-binding domain and iron-sulfur cluster